MSRIMRDAYETAKGLYECGAIDKEAFQYFVNARRWYMFQTILTYIGAGAIILSVYAVALYFACMDGFSPTTNPFLAFVFNVVRIPMYLVMWILSLFNR